MAWNERAISAGKHRAFTLVEILCVVVVLAIISSIVLPQVGSRDDLSAASAARVVMADLLYAQNRAISLQQAQYVAFDVTGQSYAIYSSMSPPLTPITNPTTGNPYFVNFGAAGAGSLANCSLSSVSFNGQTTIQFDPTGAPLISTGSTTLIGTGTIVIACGSDELTINVAQDTGDLSCN